MMLTYGMATAFHDNNMRELDCESFNVSSMEQYDLLD